MNIEPIGDLVVENIPVISDPNTTAPQVVESVLEPYLLKMFSVPHISASGADSDSKMTQLLDAVLDEAIKGYDDSLAPQQLPVGSNYKWRYSSAFQKAVRRNDPSVRVAAQAMEFCDPSYLWKRMPVIALEDIGMGDPWVCALVLHACRSVTTRRRLGPSRLASFLGELMGKAVKDRMACDLVCLVNYHKKLGKAIKAAKTWAPAALQDIYVSESQPLGWRMAAGWGLSGSRWGYQTISNKAGSGHLVHAAHEYMVPYLIQWIAKRYSSVGRDTMWLGLVLAYQMASKTPKERVKVLQGSIPPKLLIEGVLAATFDSYTHEGKRALAYYAKACEPVRSFFDRNQGLNTAKCLQLSNFTVDSSLLDRYVSFDGSDSLYATTLQAEATNTDIHIDLLAELCEILTLTRGELDAARKRVLT